MSDNEGPIGLGPGGLLDLVGGEQVEGSGFEEEIPEPDSEWRDPR
jgi:hypothetical protein